MTRTTDSLEVKVNPGEKDDWMVTLCAVLGNILLSVENIGLAQWLRGKELTCPCRRHRRYGFDPWVGKIPWKRKWQLIPVFLPGESHGERNLAGNNPQGGQESDMTERVHTHTP